MQISPDYNTTAYMIRSYQSHQVEIYAPIQDKDMSFVQTVEEREKISDTAEIIKLKHSFIISPGKLINNWGVSNPHLLTSEHLSGLIQLKPEIVLLGTGNKMHFPDPKQSMLLYEYGIGLEVMDSSAACRTYNFLVSDGRNVVAAIVMEVN